MRTIAPKRTGAIRVLKQGDDEAVAHEYLENCRRIPMHRGELT
jgi:hypothetical protein